MECSKLKKILNNNNIESIFGWINGNCNCQKCIQYKNLYNIVFDNEIESYLDNNSFKKINLTDLMKTKINNEVNNVNIKNYIFKLLKKI